MFLDLERELRQPEREETGAGRGRRRKAGTVAPGPCAQPRGTSQVKSEERKETGREESKEGKEEREITGLYATLAVSKFRPVENLLQ